MRACAYIVGPPDGPGALLRDMARELGFATVLSYQDLGAADQQAQNMPLSFFLFAAVDDVRTLSPIAHAIRFWPTKRLRFSPLIYFSESPSVDTIRACVNMGLDDVITLPFNHERVLGRLERQVDRPLLYFETQGYFGPDRRDRMPPDPKATPQREQSGQFRRIEIVRSTRNGVTVVKDEAHAAT